jgi:protein-tyrosine phosphatase
MGRLARALLLVVLLATPLAAAPDPPKPAFAEDLPRVVANFVTQVHNNLARVLGIPMVPRGPDFITRDVLLGPELETRKDYERMSDLGVTSVLDLRGEKADDREALDARGIHYKRVPVTDFEAPSEEQLREAVAWMRAEVASGRRVYVHCAAGIGRSSTVVTAFLMEEYGWSRERAWAHVESRRPIVKQTESQRSALIALEESRIARTRGASGALDRGFERRSVERVTELLRDRARDAERDRRR